MSPLSEPRAVTSAAAIDEALAAARRALISARLPRFVAGWIGVGIILRAGLVIHGGLPLPLAVVSIGLQAAVLAGAIWWCRRAPTGAAVPRVVFAACVALIVLAAGFFASSGGSVEGFVFALLLICVGSSLAFAWGWRPALGVFGACAGIGGGVIATASLHRFSDPIEIVLETLIGAAISLTVAEASARSFERTFREEQARREADRRLAAAYDAYRDLAENARDLIFTHDVERRFTYVNDAMARFFSIPASELIGTLVGDLVPRDERNPAPDFLVGSLLAGEEIPPQLVRVRRGEERRWLECVLSSMHDGDGRIVGIRGIARDVTERHSAEEAVRASLEDLRRSEERLRRLARHQASIREDERKRLGFDLHDDVCQELIGIGILVEAARRRLAEVTPEMAPELDRIGRYVGEVGEHLRQMARDLRPMLLRDLGLEESLHSLADAITAAGTPVETSFPTAIPRLDEETEIGVYRIAQEAIGNAVRHADAATIRITLAVRNGTLDLEVVDDGRGFQLESRCGTEALGLVGMEERALALGGRLELQAAPGRGTRVRLTCPVALRAPASAA
jgi:PAS domain S-box-containing protein